MICPECGIEFIPQNGNRKYCSAQCRVNRNKREADKKMEFSRPGLPIEQVREILKMQKKVEYEPYQFYKPFK